MSVAAQTAVDRQRAMVAHAYSVARTFSVLEHSVLGASVFVDASAKRRAPSTTPVHHIVERSAAIVDRIARQMQECRTALDTEWQQLRAALRDEQMAAFAADFCIDGACTRLHAPADDPLCCAPATHAMRCCGAAICEQCALQHSFESSANGTQDTAACPYCRAAYAVYAPPPAGMQTRRSPRHRCAQR